MIGTNKHRALCTKLGCPRAPLTGYSPLLEPSLHVQTTQCAGVEMTYTRKGAHGLPDVFVQGP